MLTFLKREVLALRCKNQDVEMKNEKLAKVEKRLEEFQAKMTPLEMAKEEDESFLLAYGYRLACSIAILN